VHAAPPIKLSGAMVPGGNVSGNGFVVATPSSNPAGTRAVFIADRETNGLRELWSTPIGGGTPVKLSASALGDLSVESFAVSKNGSHVVFRGRLPPLLTEPFALYRAPLDGSALAVKRSGSMVEDGTVFEYAISDDSRHIVYRADREVNERFELYSISLATGINEKLSGTPTSGNDVVSFKISPDSNRVVFVTENSGNNSKQLKSNRLPVAEEPVALSPLLPSGSTVKSYDISANSERVVYLAETDPFNIYNLYGIAIDGTGATKQYNAALSVGKSVKDFAISANSQYVAFIADQNTAGVDSLYSTPILSEGATQLSGLPAQEGVVKALKITPDSTRVIYRAEITASNTAHIFSAPITTNTTGVSIPLCNLLLSGNRVENEAFLISRDSSRVVFAAVTQLQGGVSAERLFSATPRGDNCKEISGEFPGGSRIDDERFAITADSRRVVFITNKRSNINELFGASIDGGSVVRLSGEMPSGSRVFEFAIAPDSSAVAFRSERHLDNVSELFASVVDSGGALLDIDGDGEIRATTDLLMLLRFQLGVRGQALVAGALGANATRSVASQVEDYLQYLFETASLE
jgi:dipeptidyl aminopeptidase/acylaminoacyl peptidase